jgi:prevent-host-death family protein
VDVTIRDLRNRGGEVIDNLTSGERCVITRNGTPVAELRPLSSPGPRLEAILAEWRKLPTVDPDRMRGEIDELIDMQL